MLVMFPRGVVVDTINIPDNFDELIQKAFMGYTMGTAQSYRYQDKLAFIDLCAKYAHKSHDEEEAVKKLILENTEFQLDEYGRLPDADEFWSMEFMEECYNKGRQDASLYDHYTGDHHIDDVIMKLLARAIKVVMDYEEDAQ